MIHIKSQLLNEKRAAQFLGCSRRTLQEWRRIGKGPNFIRMGDSRLIRYDTFDLQEWLNHRKNKIVESENG